MPTSAELAEELERAREAEAAARKLEKQLLQKAESGVSPELRAQLVDVRAERDLQRVHREHLERRYTETRRGELRGQAQERESALAEQEERAGQEADARLEKAWRLVDQFDSALEERVEALWRANTARSERQLLAERFGFQLTAVQDAEPLDRHRFEQLRTTRLGEILEATWNAERRRGRPHEPDAGTVKLIREFEGLTTEE